MTDSHTHTLSDFTAVRPMHDHYDYTMKKSAMELHRQLHLQVCVKLVLCKEKHTHLMVQSGTQKV